MSIVNSHQLFIQGQPERLEIAVLAGGTVCELYQERTHVDSVVGNIYRGKVRRVLPDMQAAFIDIGLDKPGFIHRRDLPQNALAITELLHQGQSLMVQVVTSPRGELDRAKGAVVTTKCKLVGKYFVWLPNEATTRVTTSRAWSGQHKKRQQELIKLYTKELTHGVLILRSSLASNSDAARQEFSWLECQWQEISASTERAPCLVYEEPTPFAQLLRAGYDNIIFADQVAHDAAVSRLHHDEWQKWLSTQQVADEATRANLQEHIHEAQRLATERVLTLENGGEIIFDRTEAMTVVDVNTAAATSTIDAHHQTNLLAAKEIARQLRLRNIGGIVIVDFIDVSGSQKSELVNQMQSYLDQDPSVTTLGAESSLGLIEITRQVQPYPRLNGKVEPCPTCGRVGTVSEVAA